MSELQKWMDAVAANPGKTKDARHYSQSTRRIVRHMPKVGKEFYTFRRRIGPDGTLQERFNQHPLYKANGKPHFVWMEKFSEAHATYREEQKAALKKAHEIIDSL